MTSASIVAAAETRYTRHPLPTETTHAVLGTAVREAIAESGFSLADIDGFGVSSFTLEPDHAIDLAWRLGIRARWLMQDSNGGASAGNLLQHAMRTVEAGDASVIVLVAGDRMDASAFTRLVERYNLATEQHLSPLPMAGPNPLFAMLTTRQMERWGLQEEDYGRLVVAQRDWAHLNPGAVYRTPLTVAEYLDAPLVAAPLRRFDCVPPVTGANAVIVAADDRVKGAPRARIRTVTTSFNRDHQEGDGLVTGVAESATRAWEQTGVDASDIDVLSVYDDYPAMVVAQLNDLGVVAAGDTSRFIAEKVATREFALNTSGGQLSAGQAGSAGGMHGVVEVVRQLQRRAGERQVSAPRIGVATGYGMVLYRYGACGNVVVMEAAQ